MYTSITKLCSRKVLYLFPNKYSNNLSFFYLTIIENTSQGLCSIIMKNGKATSKDIIHLYLYFSDM